MKDSDALIFIVGFVIFMMIFWGFLKLFFKSYIGEGVTQNNIQENQNFKTEEELSSFVKNAFLEKAKEPHSSANSNTTKIKNIDAERLESLQQKKQALVNKKIKNIDSEALKKVQEKKQILIQKKIKNIEIEALGSNYNLQNTQQTQKASFQKVTKLEKRKIFIKNKNQFKQAFILQQILNYEIK